MTCRAAYTRPAAGHQNIRAFDSQTESKAFSFRLGAHQRRWLARAHEKAPAERALKVEEDWRIRRSPDT
jgi:hypothetical protein